MADKERQPFVDGEQIMFKLTDCMIAEERRKDLLRKMERQYLIHEVRAEPRERTRRRPILAKIGNRLVRWGVYLEAHYGEPEPQPQPQVKVRA